MTRPSPARRAAFLLALGALALAAGLLTAEALVRVAYPREHAEPVRLLPDAELGWDSVPPVLEVGTGPGPVVAFVGDSFTQQTRWPGVASAAAGARGRVLGTDGFGLVQTRLKLARHWDEVRPDVVVLMLFAWNDLRDDYPYPGIYYGPDLWVRPQLVRDGAGFAIAPAVPPVFLRHSRIFQRVSLGAANKRAESEVRFGIDRFAERGMRGKLAYTDPRSWQPFYRTSMQGGAYVEGAYATMAHNLAALDRYVSERGARLVVLALDNSFTVDADVLEPWAGGFRDVDVDLPMRRLTGIASDLGLDWTSLVGPLRELAARKGAKVYNGPPGNLSAHLEPDAEVIVGNVAGRAILRGLAGEERQ